MSFDQAFGKPPSRARYTSLLFALVALAPATVAGVLFGGSGMSIGDVLADPAFHEPLLVFALPAVVAVACAVVLWRHPGRATTWLLLSCAVVILLLLAYGWLVVAFMFAAPTACLLLDRNRERHA